MVLFSVLGFFFLFHPTSRSNGTDGKREGPSEHKKIWTENDLNVDKGELI